MLWKRKFWSDHNLNRPKESVELIETSVRDLRKGRTYFEALLKKKFEDVTKGELKKLPQSELEQKIERNHVPKLAGSIKTFIQRAKNSRLTPEGVEQRIRSYDFSCEKESIFVNLAARIYHRYELNLGERMDYDDLMRVAEETIHRERGRINVRSGGIQVSRWKNLSG